MHKSIIGNMQAVEIGLCLREKPWLNLHNYHNRKWIRETKGLSFGCNRQCSSGRKCQEINLFTLENDDEKEI